MNGRRRGIIATGPFPGKGGLKGLSSPGFTLIEILVAVSILSIVMSLLYGTFTASSANARAVEERADELSSMTGAIDVLSQEIRGMCTIRDGSTEDFTGKKDGIRFAAMTPFVKDDEPIIQRVSYAFDGNRLIRKVFSSARETEVRNQSVLLDGINGYSFSFFDGKKWIDEWPSGKEIPTGIKVAFSYRGRDIETVAPVWSRK